MRSFFRNRKTVKALSMLLVVAVLCGIMPSVAVPALSEEQKSPCVLLNEQAISETVLHEGAKLRFAVGYEGTVNAYKWQIKNHDDDSWVNIADGNSRYLWVTHSLVGSMLDENGTTELRCRLKTPAGEIFTDSVKVLLSLKVNESPAYVQDASYQQMPLMLRASRASEEEFKTYSIVINYLFDDNSIAFEPYGATVAAGSPFKPENPIKSPEIMGYEPYRRVGDQYEKAEYITFDIDKVNENITINVIYEPTLVDFKVHHHLQNITDDEYSTDHLTTDKKGLTGSLVGPGLALTEQELPGFKALDYDELLEVAADGSTVVEIRYDRNYYLVSFDMSGGYGTEPVYTRYGATVGANTPVRHGYIFDGWDLVSYDGKTPTNEQKSKYSLKNGGTIEVPAANIKYKARWITTQTTYTMVFWCENANDNGYTYWGYLDNLPAQSGSFVSAQDYISRVSGIDDEQHFTFNESRSDKNIIVEGDGSTVVNAYYTRNYYTITFKASGTCTLPTSHTHTDSCYDLICGLGHVHTDECVPELICTTEPHDAHDENCVKCGNTEHTHGSSADCNCTQSEHSHTTSCWNNIGSVQSSLSGAPQNPANGQIYTVRVWFSTNYYIYINGIWYSYSGRNVSNGDIVRAACGKTEHVHGVNCSCNLPEHIHDDTCYKDTLHSHIDACYKYSCGTIEHTHSAACKRLICGLPTSHSHSGEGNAGKTVKIVYAKYRQSLKDIWPITDDNGVTYDDGQRWSPSGSTTYSQVLVYIDEMPGDDFTLTVNTSSNNTYTMNYYLQVLPGDKYDVTFNNKNYALYTRIYANYGMITKAEDFFPIRGYTQYASDPSFGNSTQIKPGDRIADFYYDRIVSQKMEFNNNGIVLDNSTVTGVMYGASVEKYNFEPPYPENLEPNAYTFDGWYTSPGCFDGTEMDWESATMPEGDLLLYAKWKPITHTVRVFKDNKLLEQIGEDMIIDHGDFAKEPDVNVTNGNYVFLGWFYEDTVNGQKVEKAFVFNGIPVLEDMNIYARWGSHFSVNYTIYYQLESGEEIAPPTTGSAIVGNNKTFYAKTEGDLNPGYQEGYYPKTSSHTITMSAEGNHVFIFVYEYVEAMPYKVQYLTVDGGIVHPEKYVWENNLSVVTETFVRANNMMPDAYQKRLVLSSDDTDEDGDGIYDDNVITFYYSSDTQHAYYRVVHYIENITGDTYREFSSEDNVGIIGEKCGGSALTLTGFAYDGSKTKVNNVPRPSDETFVEETLTENGVLIEFYYDRLDYDYTVRYVDNRTNNELYTAKTAKAAFGAQIIEYAPNFEGIGYELASEGTKLLTISANLGINVITFYYQEMTVALKYKIVGPADCGGLKMESENITAISGIPEGSAPLVRTGFAFVGWYTDEECTTPVDPSWVNDENHLKPQRIGSVWTAATYYAKIVALETDLIITDATGDDADADQVFIFRIKGLQGDTQTEHIDLTVSVLANSSVAVMKLPVGKYTVTELTDWSWRYENAWAERELELAYNNGVNELVYNNVRENGKWLDGNDFKENRF